MITSRVTIAVACKASEMVNKMKAQWESICVFVEEES